MTLQQKKIFFCDGSEFSHHPKVFFTSEFRENNLIENSCEKELENININEFKKNNENHKISCPYCGKIFN